MSPSTKPAILDRMQVLSDPMRSRLLVLLDGTELSVGELCDVLQAPQSTVSRHLRVLSDDGWLDGRRDGTTRYYAMTADRLENEASELWSVVRSHVAAGAVGEQDQLRLESVLASRRARSREFFDRSAGEWDRLRKELFGGSAELAAIFALLDPTWVVGDLGCGTGRGAERLAEWVVSVIAVDSSAAMIEEARRRLAAIDNVELRQGELERLPIEDGALDAALMVLVLHHLSSPEKALAEAARCLTPGGRLVILDMIPHDRAEYRQQMGHQWLGFSAREVESWLERAGFESVRYRRLPPDPEARGPILFVASAARRGAPPRGPRPHDTHSTDDRPVA
jgi:ArsR family transcriptional regulator